MAVKRYNGTSWDTYSGGPIPNSQIVTWKKTASGGETSLSGLDDNSTTLAYTVGQELLYVNGVLLVRGSDYTASSGTSVSLTNALVASDIVSIWCPTVFNAANTYTTSQADATTLSLQTQIMMGAL